MPNVNVESKLDLHFIVLYSQYDLKMQFQTHRACLIFGSFWEFCSPWYLNDLVLVQMPLGTNLDLIKKIRPLLNSLPLANNNRPETPAREYSCMSVESCLMK